MLTFSNNIILFDETCKPCKTLAELAARRAGPGLSFVSWQIFRVTEAAQGLPEVLLKKSADQLRVWTGSALIEGDEAWRFLLASHPDLAALNWLAVKLGLSQGTARAMQRSGGLLRRLCRKCGAPTLR